MKKISILGLCLVAGLTMSAQKSLMKEVESTIKSVEDHEIICDVVEDLKYSDLGCDTVKFKVNGRYETFKKVN